MNKKLLIALIVGLVIAAFVSFFVFGKEAVAPETQATPAQSQNQRSGAQADTILTEAEVAKHNSQEDCWTIIEGSVYDLTDFISQHPGGARAISQACGIDATGFFNGSREGGRSGGHSAFDRDQLNSLKIGDLQ